VVAALGLAVPAGATPASTHLSFKVPVTVTTSVEGSSYCDNTGPHITFSNILAVGDHWARVDFRNNTQGTHYTDAYAQVVLSLSQAGNGGNPWIYKQPPLGGVGGNPFIYFENDLDGTMHYLGRCVQDFGAGYDNPNSRWTAKGSLGGWADLVTTAFGCNNKGGSSLTVGGNDGTDGSTGHLILTNSYLGDGMPYPQHVNPSILASLGLQFAPPWTGSIPKQPPFGGAGGNPLIYIEPGVYSAGPPPSWTGDTGYTDPGLFLGRCNQLT
jgi:hypothetical protein